MKSLAEYREEFSKIADSKIRAILALKADDPHLILESALERLLEWRARLV